MNPDTPVQESEAVFRRLVEPLSVAGRELDPRLWLAVLVPVLALGLAYVFWMYARDTRSVRWYYALPLAGLRSLVYLILAVVFLLPAVQFWETTEKQSRVLLLLDASRSMDEADDPSAPAETRRAKLVRFLTDEKAGFLKRLAATNPVTAFRFGGGLDPEGHTFTAADPAWSAAEWEAWLSLDLKPWVLAGLSPEGRKLVEESAAWQAGKPGTPEWATAWRRLDDAEAVPAALSEADKAKLAEARGKLDTRVDLVRQLRSGTDLGGSLLNLVNREAGSLVQGVVVFGDGRSNLGSDSALLDARARAKADKVPVFAVQVGEDRPRTAIRITDVQAPEQTPPDERYPVAVEIDGPGLAGQEVKVALELYKPDDPKNPAATLDGSATFQAGDPPHAQAKFDVDPEKLPDGLAAADKSTGRKEMAQGEWLLKVRVPRDRREPPPPQGEKEKDHVSAPTKVRVFKRPLRVLLAAGGPMREYQFLRSLLVREDKERADLCVYLQNEAGREGRAVQDVDPERMLTKFPDVLRDENEAPADPKDRYLNLGRYDLVIAFDLDWSELTEQQIKLLHDWVQNKGGGLVVVAGPVNLYQLASAEEGGKFKPLLDLLPVKPGDSRLQNPLGAGRRNTKQGYRLNFPGARPDETDFLKLDDDKAGLLAGWEEFFTGQDKPPADPQAAVKRGFFAYYPVQAVKAGASVVATFGDPAARDGEGKEPPFLVTMKYPKGNVVFLAAAETWRLRQYKDGFYERFWTKLGRYASQGTRRVQSARGVPVVGRNYTVGGYVTLKAQLYGPDLQPLPATERPKLTLVPPGGDPTRDKREVVMGPSPAAGEWNGYFQHRFQADRAGDYRWKIDIPRSSESLEGRFSVQEADPEKDEARPDPATLYRAAGDFDDAAKPDAAAAEALRSRLRAMRPAGVDKSPTPGGDGPRSGEELRLYFTDPASSEMIPDNVEARRLVQRNRGRVVDLWDKGLDEATAPNWLRGPLAALHRVGDLVPSLKGKPVELPAVLFVVVALLSAEWLCRKLLKLA